MAFAPRRNLIGMFALAGLGLAGCGLFFPESDVPFEAIIIDFVGGTMVSQTLDGDTVYGGSSGMYCNGGSYRGGGSQASEDATKKDMENEINYEKDRKREDDKELDKCEGKRVPQSTFDGPAGCDRAQRDKYRAAYGLANFDGHPDYLDMVDKCSKADSAAYANPCNGPHLDGLLEDRKRHEKSIIDLEAKLASFKSCVDDRKRQAQANQPPRQGVDPAIILMNPGLFQPRPRQQPQQTRPPTSSGH